ncbi:MAG: hypothetical protein B7Y59_00005, partial [Burkholderiales bacterium 35-55-47]
SAVDAASLTTNAGGQAIIQGARITTSGAQTYNDQAYLGSDTTLNSSGAGDVVFNNKLDGGFNLVVNTAGQTQFNDQVGSAAALASITADAAGSVRFQDVVGTTVGGVTTHLLNVNTTGTQTYNDQAYLGSDTTLNSSGAGDVVFNNKLDGGFNLVVNTAGQTQFNDQVGSATALASITTDAAGSVSFQGAAPIHVKTIGTQTYNDPMNLEVDVAFESLGQAGPPAIAQGDISFNGAINGGFNLTVNTTGVTNFNNSIGAVTTLASVTTDAGGSVQFGGVSTVNTLSNSSFTGTYVRTTGSQAYNDTVTLVADTMLESSNEGNLAFGSTVDGGFNLTLNTAGQTQFNGQVGATTPLATITTDVLGSVRFQDVLGTTNLGVTSYLLNVNTTGAQIFNDHAYLSSDVTFASSGVPTVGAPAVANIVFNNKLDGGFNLVVNTAGVTKFNDQVGMNEQLTSITTDLPGSVRFNDTATDPAVATPLINVSTTGAQTYNDHVYLETDATFVSSNILVPADIHFNNKIDGSFDLSVNTPGQTQFNDLIGDTDRLTTITTDAPGSVRFQGPVTAGVAAPIIINTTGAQTFNDKAILMNDATFDTTQVAATGANITFGDTINGIADGAQSLTLNSGTEGVVSVVGAVGDEHALGTLTLVNSFGATFASAVNANTGVVLTDTVAGKTIAFLGSLTTPALTTTANGYNVELSGSSTNVTAATEFLNTGTLAIGKTATDKLVFAGGLKAVAPSTVSIAGGIETAGNTDITLGDTDTPVTLIADATLKSEGGAAMFGGTLDGGFKLEVNSSGITTFTGAVGTTAALTSLTTDAGGEVNVNGGSVTTTAEQVYNDALKMTGDTTLKGSAVKFNAAATGTGALTVDGAATIKGATVTTAGAQTYKGAVTLEADAVLDSTGGGDITFMTTVDGAQALEVKTSGVTTFTSDVGASSPLTSLITDEPGSVRVSSSSVKTTGLQTYNDAIELGADVVFESSGQGDVTFNGAVDGAQSLTVNTTGVTTFAKTIGAVTTLTSVTTDTGGSVKFSGAAPVTSLSGKSFTGTYVKTTGAQSYNDAVVLEAATMFESASAGELKLASTVDGEFDLWLNTAGVTSFSGKVGATTPVKSITTDAAGSTQLNGVEIFTTGAQTYADPITVSATSTLSGERIDFKSITATSGGVDVKLVSKTDQLLGNVKVAGNFSVTTGTAKAKGGVKQAAGTTISVGGLTTFTADGATNQAADLTVAENNFTGGVSFKQANGGTWASVAVTNKSGLILATSQITGTLVARTISGDITQSGPLSIDGASDFLTPDGDILLTAANNFGPGEMSISTPGKLQISAASGFILGKVSVGKTADLMGKGLINLGKDITFIGDLKVNSGGFYITQSGPMYTGGETDFDSGTGDIYLMDPKNVWKGGILYKGKIVQINHPQLLNAVSAGALLVRVESKIQESAQPMPTTTSKASSLGADITVAVGRKPTSTVPGLIDVQISADVATPGSSFSFALDPHALADQPEDAEVRIGQLDGKSMPEWLSYDAASKTFNATNVPAGAFPLQLKVSVGGVESVMVIQEKPKK